MSQGTDVAGSRQILRKKWLLLPVCFAGGMLYAAALPPLNWFFAAFFTLLPLMYCALQGKWYFRLLCGWVWGLGWSLFAYSFLREIHPAIPWLLAPVISLWPALYTMLLGFFAERLYKGTFPEFTLWRGVLFAVSAAAPFTVLEWTRYYLFVWNDLSVTLWRVPLLMQIARITGRYGVSLFITSLNAAIFSLIYFKKRRFIPVGIMLIYPALVLIYGIIRMNYPGMEDSGKKVIWKCALIQGDLPQQRRAGEEQILNSIMRYFQLSLQMKKFDPDTIIWPECAVPIPLRSNIPLAQVYREAVKKLDSRMLIGSLDFSEEGGMTNSALLIKPGTSWIIGKYDKYHRVPFGEYVPFRSLLPASWIKAFDMGRDLTGGKNILPLRINENVSAGTAVCYEGVFSYMSAAFAREGANVLTAISNDVWYPQSSEPEQHLANAVMRCVETGLPMVRSGNNGGSGVVTEKGVFTQYIGTAADRPELLRESAAGIVTVELEKHPQLTFAVRYENLIVYLLFAGLLIIWFASGHFPVKVTSTSSCQTTLP